ncbi:MAG: CBS domain-containing protein [Balneolaceae bacterium]|nr:MAG: CBS domain-containing protein [Balneolaceae bacterium]
MKVHEVVSQIIRPLRAMDTAREALAAMAESGMSALPVVDQTTRRFIGVVTRASAEQHHVSGGSVLTIREEKSIVTDPDQHVFDAVRLMEKHNLTILPVLDSDRSYVGVVDRRELNDRIITLMNFTEYGSLITIHFEERDFTLSQPVRIIEAEGGLILGLSVESPKARHPFYVVSIKLNLTDPGRIVASLKRHDYIVDQHSSDDEEDRRYEQRADELMHYLNI